MIDPDTPCVIDATFHDWRTVKGRKMLQLIFEVPLDEQGDVLTLLGPPDSVGSKWCMIALKNPALAREKDADLPSADDVRGILKPQASEASGHPKDEGAYLVQQCAIACADARFQMFLRQRGYSDVRNEEDAARVVRSRLDIGSRAELKDNARAQNEWKLFHDWLYQNWLTDLNFGGVRR